MCKSTADSCHGLRHRLLGVGTAEFSYPPLAQKAFREQKRHIKLWHIKLCPAIPVAGLPGHKDLCSLGSEDSHERKKHPKKICLKNFGGTLAGGSRRGFRRPNSLCRCWFSQQNTVHKEFRGGGGLRGSWGSGLRSNFGAHFFMFMCFLGFRG